MAGSFGEYPLGFPIGIVDGREVAISDQFHEWVNDFQRAAAGPEAVTTVSLTGDVTGNIGSGGQLPTVIQKDSTVTLTGDATGSGTMSNLGSVSIAVLVPNKVNKADIADLGTAGSSTTAELEAKINAILAALR